jgi:ankyrin repeat protein
VKVQGLTSEAGQLLNGKCGTVQTYAADKGRWEVIIENVKGRKALKHANLLFDREEITLISCLTAICAAQNGHEACLLVLRDAGCDLSQATNGGTTPAIMACQNGHDSCLALLRDAGCDLNQAMNVGVTPAFIAAGEGHESCLVLLRDAGCDLGQGDNDGYTPAYYAAQHGHRACLIVLRDAGCDMTGANIEPLEEA